MDNAWSYNFKYGKFIIKLKNGTYELFFEELFGDVARYHNSENLEEIWSFLLTIKNLKTKSSSRLVNMAELGIPTELDEWEVIS